MPPSCVSFLTHTFSVPIQNNSLVWIPRGLGLWFHFFCFFSNCNLVTSVFHPLYLEITVNAFLQKYLLVPFSIHPALVLSPVLVESLGAWWSFWRLGLLEQYWLPNSIHSHFLFPSFVSLWNMVSRVKPCICVCVEFPYSHVFCLKEFGFTLILFFSVSLTANL